MGILRLFRFFNQATDYLEPDASAVDQAGELGPRHARYHKRIVWVSSVFGAIGALLGVTISLMMAGQVESGKDIKGVLLGPFLFGAGGLLFGSAMACLFAPGEFLAGPLGQKWMQLIGTKNVLAARIVCGLVGVVVMAPFVGLGLLLVFGQ